MKTIVIYSGQTRTFAQCMSSHWFRLLRHLDNPVIVASVADDEQAADMELVRKLGIETHIERVQQPTVKEPAVMPGMLGIYPPSTDPQGILKQLWSLNRAWQFANEVVKIDPQDNIIRIRPDLVLDRVLFPAGFAPYVCYSPWWACWGGVNDRLAIMGVEAAAEYFGTWNKLDLLIANGCPLHPETLIYESLRSARPPMNIHRDLEAEFVTLRLDGSVVPMSITAADLAHFRQ